MNNTFINFYDKLFTSNEVAIEFLERFDVFKQSTLCLTCGVFTKIRKRDKSRLNGVFYYCKLCKHKTNFTDGTCIQGLKLEISLLLRVIYGFLANFDYCQIELLTCITDKTYTKIKKILISKIKEKAFENFPKIGGPNIRVQIDETAICRGRIITDPSNASDDMDGIQWLIGGIENTSNKYIFLEIIPNRTISTFFEVFQRHLNRGTIIVSDGHPSYPGAARLFGSTHIVVPHNRGFINEEGDHTNLIENLWSHLKIEYRKRRGIQVSNMEDFIFEFYFKKIFISKRSPIAISNSFIKILEILFD